jgi:hypothetical protein
VGILPSQGGAASARFGTFAKTNNKGLRPTEENLINEEREKATSGVIKGTTWELDLHINDDCLRGAHAMGKKRNSQV